MKITDSNMQLRVAIRSKTTEAHSVLTMPSTPVNTSLPKFIMSRFMEAGTSSRVALTDASSLESRTFGQLYQNTTRVAHALRRLGITSAKDCVALISPNHVRYFEAFHGIGLTGGFSTPINPMYTETEIAYQLEATNARIVISHPSCLEKGGRLLTILYMSFMPFMCVILI